MNRTVMFGWRSRKAATTSSSRHVDGALNVPSATSPLRIAVNSPTLPAASSSARRLAAACSAKAWPGVGREDAAPGADEQVGAQRALELADLLGDGGLRHPQGVRRGAERPELQRRAEAADLLERQKLSF